MHSRTLMAYITNFCNMIKLLH